MIYAHLKLNEAYTFRFPGRDKTTGNLVTGLATWTVKARKADETILTPDPTVTELTLGEYKISFTPDATGIWSVKISQASIADIYVHFRVTAKFWDTIANVADILSDATAFAGANINKLTFNASNEVAAAINNAAAFAQAAADKIWSSASRTLSTFGTLVSDVWANSSRTLTSLGSSLVAEVWNALASGMTTVGSVGKRIADNLDATVSSRSTLTAADVWANATRTLTSFGTLVSDIWSNATRSLTDKAGFELSTAGIKAIWDQATAALTTVGSIGKLLVDRIDQAISAVAASVWGYDLSTTDEDAIAGRKGASVLMAVFKRFYHKVTQSGTQQIVYKADNSTAFGTMSTTEGPPQEKGKAA